MKRHANFPVWTFSTMPAPTERNISKVMAFPLAAVPAFSPDVATTISIPADYSLWGIETRLRGQNTAPSVFFAVAPKNLAEMKTANGAKVFESLPVHNPIAVSQVAAEWVPLIFFRYASIADASRDPLKFTLAYMGEQINLANFIVKPKSEVTKALTSCSAFALNVAADSIDSPLFVVPAFGQALAVVNYVSTLSSLNDCAKSLLPFASRLYDYVEESRVKEEVRVKKLTESIIRVRGEARRGEAEAEARRIELNNRDPIGVVMDGIAAAPPPSGAAGAAGYGYGSSLVSGGFGSSSASGGRGVYIFYRGN